VTKPNPENCKNCSSKCAYDCAQLQYTIQNRTVQLFNYVKQHCFHWFLIASQFSVISIYHFCNKC